MTTSCNITAPINQKYLTSADFPEWSDYFDNLCPKKDGKEEETILQDFINNKPAEVYQNSGIRTKNITFVVTERCNLNCTYCYESHEVHKHGKRMTKKIAKEAVDFIFDKEKINGYYNFKQSRAVILDIIGGEPLLEIDLIDYLVDYFKYKAIELDHPWATNFMISMSTNGLLYNTPKVQKFLKKNKGKVSISISIDGDKKLHDACRVFPNGEGSYDIVVEGVKQLVKDQCSPTTKLTLAPENLQYFVGATKHLWDLGLKGIYSNPVFEKGWKTEHATIFYNELIELADYIIDNNLYYSKWISLFDESIGQVVKEDKNWCGGNGEMLAIGPDGKCFPCLRYMQHSLKKQKEKPIGSIQDGLESIDESPFLNELRDLTMTSQSTDKCINCKIATGCAWCTAYNYDEFGTTNKRATFICEMHQARVMANYYYWKKLYSKLKINKKITLNIPKEWALKIINQKQYQSLLEL